jgi:hypothetical protein
MKPRVVLVALLVWAAQAPAREPAASPGPTEPTGEDRLQSLDAGQLQSAIDVLRQRHVASASLDETGLTRATLRGLLEGLAPGAELVGETGPAPDSPFRSEILDGRIGYIRVGSLRPETLARLDAALREFRKDDVQTMILDLRATPESHDFESAARMASPFVPKDAALFTLTKAAGGDERTFRASGTPVFRGVLAVLVDEDTAGAAEVLAGALRRYARAMIVGSTTAGRAVEFEEAALGGGPRLRFAAGEVRVPGLPAVYPEGLAPDLEVPQDAAERDEIFAAALEGGMTSFVFEKGRAQMNEAALVAGTNPELAGTETASALLDRPLQSAVDLVTAIRIFRGLK